MKPRRIYLVGLVLLAVIAVFGAVIWSKDVRDGQSVRNRTDNVTVAQVGQFFIYMPLYYASERGYFLRNGLSVKIVNSGGDDKSVAAVLAGSADFGVGDPTFAAIAKEQGQDIRVVASVVNGVPFWGVTKKASIKPFTDAAMLRGLTVATFPKPSTAYTLQSQMFVDGGLKPSILEAQFGSLLPLLDTGVADIVLELEPNVSTAVANGGHVVYSMPQRYPDFAITGVTVSGGTLSKRPDVVRRFVASLDQAEQAAHANPADVIAFAKSRFPNVPPAVAEAAIKRMLDSGVFPAAARVSESGWTNAINLRVKAGDLKGVSAGKGVVDNDFVQTR